MGCPLSLLSLLVFPLADSLVQEVPLRATLSSLRLDLLVRDGLSLLPPLPVLSPFTVAILSHFAQPPCARFVRSP